MAAARQGLPVRLDRAPQRGAAFALTRASRRARTRSIGSRSRATGSLSHRPRDGSVVSSLHCMNDPQPEGHMASYIRRRKFLATLGGAAAAWPLVARAQPRERMRRIGVLMSLAADDPEGQARLTAFVQGLQELGWT